MELLSRLFREFCIWDEFLLLKLVGLPFALLHEFSHFVVAWALGLNPEFHLDHVTHEFNQMGIFVTVAPIVLGYGICFLGLLWGFEEGNYFLIFVTLVWSLAWQLECQKDYIKLLKKLGW